MMTANTIYTKSQNPIFNEKTKHDFLKICDLLSVPTPTANKAMTTFLQSIIPSKTRTKF